MGHHASPRARFGRSRSEGSDQTLLLGEMYPHRHINKGFQKNRFLLENRPKPLAGRPNLAYIDCRSSESLALHFKNSDLERIETMAKTPKTTEAQNLTQMTEAVSAGRIKRQMAKIADQFDAREAFELKVAPANTSIQAKLKTYRAKIAMPGIAALTLAAEIDPAFLNRATNETSGKRFNVYAIAKVADLLTGINSGVIKNAANKCIVASLFKCEAAKVPFTGQAAQGCISANLKIDKVFDGLLERHTAAPGTAPTQSSSTMNALAVIGAVENKGSAKHPIWQLTETPIVARLRELV